MESMVSWMSYDIMDETLEEVFVEVITLRPGLSHLCHLFFMLATRRLTLTLQILVNQTARLMAQRSQSYRKQLALGHQNPNGTTVMGQQ